MSENTSISPVKAQPDYEPVTLMGGIKRMPVSRQITMIVALALALAVGVAVALWMQKPDYGKLYSGLADKEMGGVLEAVEKLNIEYKIDETTGAVLVPKDKVHEIRLKLAAQGLPESGSLGYELLDRDTGYGSSQALETIRFQRALEGEIARSVMAIQGVRSARVHLAIPKQSVFIRDRKPPSASVLVDLYPGRSLEKPQVEAIVHLVASSVPQMETGQVTVVDQKGELLNAKDNADNFYLTAKQFEYKKQVEDYLAKRVENILAPLVGADRLRAQIATDIDFSLTEKTQEKYTPETAALRSEQTSEEQNRNGIVAGIPGALSNQPPGAGVAPEVANAQNANANPATTGQKSDPLSSSKSATRNYELDKVISHTSPGGSELRRLTVAVVVDHQRSLQDGKEITNPYPQAELDRFTDLVKQAVGFNAARGDQVTVTNAAFMPADPVEPLPELPIWERDWFVTLMKIIGPVLIVALLVFGVFRPVLKGLLPKDREAETPAAELPQLEAGEGAEQAALASPRAKHKDGELDEDRLTLSHADFDDELLQNAPQSYEKRLAFAKTMVDEDAKRVAQVIKAWIANDG